jgi:hypothetical protein
MIMIRESKRSDELCFYRFANISILVQPHTIC